MYNRMHDESRLPFDVKNWIEKHVEEKKDWREMKDLLQLSNEEMNEVSALRVHRHDIVNQIQQRLNNISRKHRIDRQSTQAWINILKKKVIIPYLKLLIHPKLTKS
ncbi:hypothetical protein BDC45DRAFT_511774 [Circinella umbellata]|nr:hypothetical protein BDC45DRAFT_511774 [Circinella umbellata]